MPFGGSKEQLRFLLHLHREMVSACSLGKRGLLPLPLHANAPVELVVIIFVVMEVPELAILLGEPWQLFGTLTFKAQCPSTRRCRTMYFRVVAALLSIIPGPLSLCSLVLA